jgi:ATP-dependent DNA ligase
MVWSGAMLGAPTGENWARELKYDGFRFDRRLGRGKVKLLTHRISDSGHRR